MKRITTAVFAMVTAVAANAADAEFDGSKRLICAPVQVMDCSVGDNCLRGLPDEFGAPSFLRVDVAGKRVIGPKVESEILLIDRAEGQLLLTGKEFSFVWTMAINTETGAMTTSMTNRFGAYIMFGNCTTI